jgi:hypothetical protein
VHNAHVPQGGTTRDERSRRGRRRRRRRRRRRPAPCARRSSTIEDLRNVDRVANNQTQNEALFRCQGHAYRGDAMARDSSSDDATSTTTATRRACVARFCLDCMRYGVRVVVFVVSSDLLFQRRVALGDVIPNSNNRQKRRNRKQTDHASGVCEADGRRRQSHSNRCSSTSRRRSSRRRRHRRRARRLRRPRRRSSRCRCRPRRPRPDRRSAEADSIIDISCFITRNRSIAQLHMHYRR